MNEHAPAISSAGQRRRRSPLARLASWFGAAILIVATVAAGRAIVSYTSDINGHTRPFVRTGGMGEPADARTFSVSVVAVRGALTIEVRNQYHDDPTSKAKAHDTSGVWVLVRVRVVARDKPTLISYAVVRDMLGRTYRATERISQPMFGRILQPGVSVEGELVFEVPRDAATSLAVRVGDRGLDQRMDALAEVPLPVTQATVDGWLARSGAAVVGTAVVVR